MNATLEKVLEIVENQNRWRRRECVNLIASENVMSPLAERVYLSDFKSRYNEHDEHAHYQGTRYSMEIEHVASSIIGERFGTDKVEVRPLSGALSNLIVYRALLKYGDIFMAPGLTAGGHVSSTRYGVAGKLGLKDVPMPFDVEEMQVDVDETLKLIRLVKPKLIMFGRSMFLFPEPVSEIASEVDVPIVYDAAHVFGLVYSGFFQDPLREGAQIMTSSTHKTFPGPQGGIIIGRDDLDDRTWRRIERTVFPGIISNHHIHRLPALAITALEMNEFGREYAKQIVKNAKALAQALYELGFDVLCEHKGFTESHQVLVDVRSFGGGANVAKELEEANIILNKIALPWDSDKDATGNPSGIRIGVQEMTRYGMRESEMEAIAGFFKEVLIDKKEKEKVKEEVIEFRQDFLEVKFCYTL